VRGGVDLKARRTNGDNALHYLVRYGDDRVEPFVNLVKVGIDPLCRNADGLTPLGLLRAEKAKEKYFKRAFGDPYLIGPGVTHAHGKDTRDPT
jgi:hypothetical protein